MKITKKRKIFEYYLYDNYFKKNSGYIEIGNLHILDEPTTRQLVVGSIRGDLYIESDNLLYKLIDANFIGEWRDHISEFIVNQLFNRSSLKEGSPGNFPWCKTTEECLIILKMLYDLQNDIYNTIQNQCYDENEKILVLKTIISHYKNENS